MLGYQESKKKLVDAYNNYRLLWDDVFHDALVAQNYALLDAWNSNDPEIQPVVIREFYDFFEGDKKMRAMYKSARFKDPQMIEAIAHCRFCPMDIIEDIVMWQKTSFLTGIMKHNPNKEINAFVAKEVVRRTCDAVNRDNNKISW